MSYALGHFSIGATISLILFRIFSDKAKDYLNYDLVVASIGGVWAMIPDFPYLFGVMKPLCTGSVCNIFFFHGLLDYTVDPNDSIIISAILFGLFLLVLNLMTFKAVDEK